MKKLISIFLLVSLLVSCAPAVGTLDPNDYETAAVSENTAYTEQPAWNGATSDTSWYDDEADTLYLADGADLKGFISLVSGGNTFEGKTVKLSNDINLGGKAWSGVSSNLFKGVFDGQGYTIGSFTMSVTASHQSLLGSFGGSAVLKNLTITDGSISFTGGSGSNVNSISGILARIVTEAGKTVEINNVTAGCKITFGSCNSCKYIGGIVGLIEGSGAVKITNCTNTGNISVSGQMGGIVGYVKDGVTSLTIQNCHNTGNMTVYYSSIGSAAGILGEAKLSGGILTITDCTNSGTMKYSGTKNKGGTWLGGIVGYVYGTSAAPMVSVTVNNCHSTGNITNANRTSGGLVGYIQHASSISVTNCTVKSNMTFNVNDTTTGTTADRLEQRYVGGLIGAIHMPAVTSEAIVSSCSVSGTLTLDEAQSNNSRAGGLIGLIRGSNVQASNCLIDVEFSKGANTEEDDLIGVTVGGFETAGYSPTTDTARSRITASTIVYNEYNTVATAEDFLAKNKAFFQAIGQQYRYNEQSNTYDLRYVFGVNNLQENDLGVGFELFVKTLGESVQNRNIKAYCSTIYSKISADGVSYTASEFGCQYLCTLSIVNIPAKSIELILENGNTAAYLASSILQITPFTTTAANQPYTNLEGAGTVTNQTSEPTLHTFNLEDFTPYLPSAFAGQNGILSDKNISFSPAANLNCITASQLGSNDQYVLQESCTCGGSCAMRAHGAVAYRLNASVPYHYYLDVETFNLKFNPDISDRYEAYHTWTFTVAEDGYYDLCFRIRLAGDNGTTQTRYALVQFDNESYSNQTELYYSVVVRDGTMRDNADNCDAYITGYGKYLTAGTHTITFRLPYDGNDGTVKSAPFHIRDIYFRKDAAEPVDANIPLPQGATLYDGNFDNNVTYVLDGTTETVFNAYRNTLVANGFSLADYRVTDFQYSSFDVTNTPADGNYTYTGNYVDDRTYYNYYYIYTNADYMLNVYFCTATGDMRVIVSDIEEYEKYDTVNDASPAYTTVTTPLFAMLDIGGQTVTLDDGTTKDGPIDGQCLIYRLSDGRFVIVDGGYWYETDSDGEEIARLYKWLKDNSVNGEVKIAAWLITHHHSDHILVPWKFAQMYPDVVVENYLYNFPSYEYAASLPNADLKPINYTRYYPMMHSLLGQKNTMVVHSGMVYNFADISIEILFTHEDFYPNEITAFNNSSTLFKITLAGKTFLVGGDLHEEAEIKAIKKCGTLLDSDFVQLFHHGFNGQVEFYKYAVGLTSSGSFDVAGTTILWPQPQGVYYPAFSGYASFFEGTAPHCVANRWLLDTFCGGDVNQINNTSSTDTTSKIHSALACWVFTAFN